MKKSGVTEPLHLSYEELHERYKNWSELRKNRVDEIYKLGLILLRGGLPEGKDNINLKNYLTYFIFSKFQDTECYDGKMGDYEFLEDLEYAVRRATIDYFGLGDRSFTDLIRDYCVTNVGTFSCNDLRNELHIVTRQDKDKLRVVLHRLKKEGLIEGHRGKAGFYRIVSNDLNVIDIKNPDIKEVNIKYPLDLHELFITRPKNLIVIAGEQDSGKSTFCLNVARKNLNRDYQIRYISSEMEKDELIPRLKAFEPDTPYDHWLNVEFISKSFNFQDYILPNAINVIDYYEISDAFYKIAEFFTSVYEKLDNGIAVIALQKDSQKEYGRGASFSMEKPRLYLTLSSNPPEGGIAKIMKAKNWRRQDVNPNRRECNFKIVNGCNMYMVGDWVKPSRG